jgi:hypothetical protein
MKTPLIHIDILSIYKNKLGDRVPLPNRMARCTPDTFRAIMGIAKELAQKGGKLILSDLYRTYEMQSQSHQDYIAGRKKAFSPPPGGSFHEAGRALDLDLGSIKIKLADFWKIAEKHGMFPIIDEPKITASEAWHFDCRGSHQIVYHYYKDKKGNNFKPYTAAAASAILSTGVQVDKFESRQQEALIQSCLIRLGKEIGNIDGQIGKRTRQALEELQVPFNPNRTDEMVLALEDMVQQKFPMEFRDPGV